MDNKYGRKEIPNKQKASVREEKYWGWMQRIFTSDNLCIKQIIMNKNEQSSLEYHVSKEEYYFILKGKLKVGMRIGRAENKSIILEEGDVFHIPPGLMHMRIALKDTHIIEWSNVDDDSDSNIVEDGKFYIFEETT
ncbi:cupin domain-containing protein [Alphaproteobacteria bacterium]|nr:cupin domain-containing protein [Alphaproteobacteria bacterium]